MQDFPDNGLFQVRGNAGTHDLALGKKTLQELQDAGTSGTEVRIPSYDKAAHNGKGDRKDPADWPVVKGPVDVVLFEGWMFGFRELPSHDAFKANKDLAEVNARLRHYVNAWDTYMDAWLVLKANTLTHLTQTPPPPPLLLPAVPVLCPQRRAAFLFCWSHWPGG